MGTYTITLLLGQRRSPVGRWVRLHEESLAKFGVSPPISWISDFPLFLRKKEKFPCWALPAAACLAACACALRVWD